MFKKEITKKGNAEIVVVKNREAGFSMSVVSGAGAYLNSLVLNNKEVIDGAENDDEILRNPDFKSVLLAPFPNRIKDGKYSFNSSSFQLEINEVPRNNALHGLIFKAPFRLAKEILGDDEAVLEFEHKYTGGQGGYPFQFSSHITYKISLKDGFSCTMKFSNHEKTAIPFGFGWHPYFTLGKPVDELLLKTVPLQRFEVDVQMIPTGKITEANDFVEKTPLKGLNPDDCFLISNTGNTVITELSDNFGNTLSLWQETGDKKLNFLQVYVPPHRKSIAIEPQTCCIDAFNNKTGYFELGPEESTSATLGVKLN